MTLTSGLGFKSQSWTIVFYFNKKIFALLYLLSIGKGKYCEVNSNRHVNVLKPKILRHTHVIFLLCCWATIPYGSPTKRRPRKTNDKTNETLILWIWMARVNQAAQINKKKTVYATLCQYHENLD